MCTQIHSMNFDPEMNPRKARGLPQAALQVSLASCSPSPRVFTVQTHPGVCAPLPKALGTKLSDKQNSWIGLRGMTILSLCARTCTCLKCVCTRVCLCLTVFVSRVCVCLEFSVCTRVCVPWECVCLSVCVPWLCVCVCVCVCSPWVCVGLDGTSCVCVCVARIVRRLNCLNPCQRGPGFDSHVHSPTCSSVWAWRPLTPTCFLKNDRLAEGNCWLCLRPDINQTGCLFLFQNWAVGGPLTSVLPQRTCSQLP